MSLGLVAITYAFSIPTALWVCSDGDWSSVLLKKAAKGCSQLKPLFRVFDRLELILLSPIYLAMVVVVTPVAMVQTALDSRPRRKEPPCFLPALRSVMPDAVVNQFDDWEKTLAEVGAESSGDYMLRQRSLDKLVRYLLPSDGLTIIEAYWLVDHFELSCSTALEDGSFVSTHWVTPEIFIQLKPEADKTTDTRRQLILTKVEPLELYQRHLESCREWANLRGVGVRPVTRENYRDIVIANEVDANQASTAKQPACGVAIAGWLEKVGWLERA